MSLQVVNCEEPKLSCFLEKVEHEGLGNITSLAKSNIKAEKSIVVAKIVRVISTYSLKQKRVVLLLKEVLPTCEYGEKFTAIIHCELALQLNNFSPQIGDRLAFFEPAIFPNPSFYDENHPNGRKPTKYLLEIGLGEKKALMWSAKKQVGLARINTTSSVNKSSDHFGKNITQNKTNCPKPTAPMDPQDEQGSHGKKKIEISVPKKTGSSTSTEQQSNIQVIKVVDVEKIDQPEGSQANSCSPNSPVARLKPHIQLPDKPQLPSNTQRLNPRYQYKKLADIKENALSGDLGRVNMFAVVHEIVKSLVMTSAGKYTIICKIVDDSMKNDMDFYLSFFTQENTIVEQIEEGDILRLHRVKMELYKNDADGRVFNSNDIVLFKKNTPETPIFTAKNTEITDEEKKIVENLKTWYKTNRQPEMGEVVLLSDIAKEGVYKIACKLVSQPTLEAKSITFKVTDGSEIKHLVPALPLRGSPRLVTEIVIFENEHLNFKADEFLFLHGVKASVAKEGIVLKITDHVKPIKITDNSHVFVREITRRLKSYQTKRKENESEIEILNEVPKNNQNIVQNVANNSSNDKGEKSTHKTNVPNKIKTKDEEMESRVLSCDNRLCAKTKVVGDEEKDDKSDLDSAGTKARKQLFTQNYTDMSDATDEASELLEVLTQPFRPEANKDMSLVIVNPATTNLDDVCELIKNLHSPRKPTSQDCHSAEDPRPRLASLRNASKHKMDETEDAAKTKLKLPVVKLKKLTEDECKSTSSRLDAQDKPSTRKRVSDSPVQDYSREDLEDADTLVNFSLQNCTEEPKQTNNKRKRLESESTMQGAPMPKDKTGPSEDQVQAEEVQVTRNQKVTSWLLDPNNKLQIGKIMEMDGGEELDSAMVAYILLGKEPENYDLSKYLTTPIKRLKVFLIDVLPNPTADPLDLVSGYCHSGCRQLFIFSKIHWAITEDNYIPHCPGCFHTDQEKLLELLLVMELRVMDTNGQFANVLVCREYAEHFLNCSTIEFLMDTAMRTSRTQLLSDYIVGNRYQLEQAPLMDISVQQLGKVLCLISTSLNLPVTP